MANNSIRRFTKLALASAASLTLAACATIPGANVAPATPITAAEAQQGAEYHPQFIAEFGGEMTGPYAQYVDQIGSNIAVQSGLANSRDAFDVTLLNSSVNNAFAVPGGYVYATRQLVTLMNNEAELAAVLGHEVGHVAARHSARRQQTAQRNQLLGLLGTVIGAAVGSSELAQLSQQGSQLLDAQLFAQSGAGGRSAGRAISAQCGLRSTGNGNLAGQSGSAESARCAIAGPRRCDDSRMGINTPRSRRPRAKCAATCGRWHGDDQSRHVFQPHRWHDLWR